MTSSVGATTSIQDQDAMSVSREAETLERQCWVCFVTDKEAPAAGWVQPCRCRGTSRWVHISCLLRWVDERQKGQLDAMVRCSQCQTPYEIRLPPANAVEASLDSIQDLFHNTSPLVSLGGLLGACVFCLFKFGEGTVYMVLGSAEAQRIVDETDPVVTICGFTLLPVAFLGVSIVNWEDQAVKGYNWIYPQAHAAFHSIWEKSRNATQTDLPEQRIDRVELPLADEPQIVDQAQTNNAQFEATVDGLTLSRTLMNAVSLPFIAMLCGRGLFGKAVKGSVKRTVLGGLAFLLLKSGANLYLDYRHKTRLKDRIVSDQLR